MILALLACALPDLAQEWDLDRLRLLAVRAEPAEPRPGDIVTFTSLRYVPDGAAWASIWIACLLSDVDGCSFDASLFDRFAEFDTLTPEEQAELIVALQAAGFIGFEPGLSPTWPVPEDALDTLSPEQLLEGTSASVQITLTTDDDTELVLKNVPVSLATTPNTNPDVASFSVDAVAAAAGEVVTVEAGATVAFEATVAALEEYAYVTTSGEAETRMEELSWRWYVDGGEIGLDFGGELDPEPEDSVVSVSSWIAPEKSGSYLVYAVVLDGRGGMGWWEGAVTVE